MSEGVQVADVQVAELDQARHEAQIVVTLNGQPSDRWMELFMESRGRENGAAGAELHGSTITLWGRADTDALVRHVTALRELIERVNVRIALEARMARERA